MGWCLSIPLHVTGVWLPIPHPDPQRAGSLGFGLLLYPPARARVEPCTDGRCRVVLRQPSGEIDVGRASVVVEALGAMGGLHVNVTVESPAPLAAGYAVSAVLALAVAVGEGLWRGWSLERAAVRAHEAEVLAGTGLGDVVAVFQARMAEVRTAPGAPGIGRVESVPVDFREVYSLELGRMETVEMHRRLSGRLEQLAAKHLRRVLENPTPDTMLEEARLFSIEAGFAPGQLAERLEKLRGRGLIRGWYVKKRVAIVVPESEWAADVLAELERLASRYGYRVWRHRPAPAPLTVWRC